MLETIYMQSAALGESVMLNVITPDDNRVERLMILLHGNMNPEASESVFGNLPMELNLEELCSRFHIAVVIPLMKNRYYISTDDYDCDRYVAYEIPEYMKMKYHFADSIELILAGISMGGFGAVLIGARTGVFQKIISVSGAFIAKDVEIGNPEVWGNLAPGAEHLKKTFLYYFMPLGDLAVSVERNAEAALELFCKRGDHPDFVITCGTEDWLYPRNMRFLEALENRKLGYQFYALENGAHDAKTFQDGLWKAVDYLL